MSTFVQAAQSGNTGKFVKFKQQGDTFTGIISAPVVMKQATEYGTKAPKFFPSGDPILEEWINLDDVTAPTKEEAASTLVVGYQAMRKAIGEAIIAAGATDLQVGGTLQVTRTGYGVGKNPSNPPISWSARYEPPAAPAGSNWGQ